MEMFGEIAARLGTGGLRREPVRVSGGYMHRMYRLDTDGASYAVKLLNPSIMKRPDAADNFLRAERLERMLERAGIPIVAAIEEDGCKMQRIGEQYYYVFPWVEGSTAAWDEIRPEQCRKAGAILARIHRIDRRNEPVERDELRVDWDGLIKLAQEACPALGAELSAARDTLYAAENEYNRAWSRMPKVSCVSNADMDSKNVMWRDGEALVIDLECLDYGQPAWDMFSLALSWSGLVLCKMDYERLRAFIGGYEEENGPLGVEMKDLYGAGFSWLEWLEYNVRRAAGAEASDAEEQEMGLKEAEQTLRRIGYYASVRDEMLHALSGQ